MEPERQHKRYKIDPTGVESKMVFARYVKILNMSIGGVALQTDRRMAVGSKYTLKIESKGRPLSIKGIVVWSVLSESIRDAKDNMIPIYTAGMKFTDTSREKIDVIVNFIEDHKRDAGRKIDPYSRSGLRLHVRIHIESPEKVTLNFQEGHKVKNLSLGGMLVESENPLEIDSKLPLEIALGQDKNVRATGRVVSCLMIKKSDLELYDIGIEFSHMSAKDKEILESFILSRNPS